MRLAIIGAGNGGHAMAAELTLAGHDVVMCSRNQEKLGHLQAKGGIGIHGVLGERTVPMDHVTSDVADAVDGADLVALPVPGMVQEDYLDWVLPVIGTQAIWLSPGTGGSLIAAEKAGNLGVKVPLLIETVTLPYAARLTGPARVGISALINLRVAAFPANHVPEALSILKRLYDEVRPDSAISGVRNVLDTALNNVNCLVHPQPSLMNMGWIEAREREFSLYGEGMTPSVLKVLYAIDRERQAIVEAVGLDVLEIDEIYELIGTGPIYRQSMGLGEKSERFYDRFFTEDVPVGLVTLQSVARAAGVHTPLIDATVTYSNAIYDSDFVAEGRTLERLGLGGMKIEEIQQYLETGIRL